MMALNQPGKSAVIVLLIVDVSMISVVANNGIKARIGITAMS
jgi:hypothetical protein